MRDDPNFFHDKRLCGTFDSGGETGVGSESAHLFDTIRCSAEAERKPIGMLGPGRDTSYYGTTDFFRADFPKKECGQSAVRRTAPL